MFNKSLFKNKMIKIFSIVLLLSVTLIWGYSIIATDNTLNGMGANTMLSLRFLIAAVVIFIIRLFLKKSELYTSFTKYEIIAGILLGIVNFIGFYFQSIGLLYTNTAKSGMLTGSYVVIVPVVYCILRKKFQIRPIINGIIFLIGLFFLFDFRGSDGINRGDFYTIICSCFFAAQLILVDRIMDKINVFNFNFFQLLTMGILGAIGMLIKERNTLDVINWGECIPSLLYLGVLSSAYAYIAQTYAQKNLTPSLTAILLSFESLSGVMFSVMLGKANMTLYLAIGCVIMVIASISASIEDAKIKTLEEKSSEEENWKKEGKCAGYYSASYQMFSKK